MDHGSNRATIIKTSVTCEADKGMIAIHRYSLAAKPSLVADINAAIYQPFSGHSVTETTVLKNT